MREYGPGTFISSSKKEGERYTYGVGIKTPIEVSDATEFYYSIRTIPDIVKIVFEQTGNGMYSYHMNDFETLSRSLERKDHILIHRMERELNKETYRSIARIPTVANTMTPLMGISNLFRSNESITSSEILKIRDNKEQMVNYIKFMIRNGFLIEENRVLFPTQRLLEYLDKEDGPIYVPLIGEMLKSGYIELLDLLHLSGLKPYMTVAFSYYMPSSQARNLLKMKIENLRSHYKRIYKYGLNRYKLQNHVSMLSDVDVLSIQDKLIVGKESIFRNQLKTLDAFA